MQSFTVNYNIAAPCQSGSASGMARNDLFESTGSYYEIVVTAPHQGAARDMVIGMNGGAKNCRINWIRPQ
jgi:hypothetical protein